MPTDDPPRRLYLASASPRRAQLLEQAGYRFEQRPAPLDEAAEDIDGLTPERAVAVLAERKAAALAQTLETGIVLGCDTLLSVDGHPVGKPADADEARSVLESLIGRSHEAITALCLIDAADRRQRALVDTATVRIGQLDAPTLDRYIESGEWRDKAGGYNLAELTGRWPIEVDGDPDTVVGLPLERLTKALKQFAPDLSRATEP